MQSNCLTFALGGGERRGGNSIFVLLDSTQTFIYSRERHYLYLPKLSVIYMVLKEIVANKTVSAPSPKTHRNARDPWRIVS